MKFNLRTIDADKHHHLNHQTHSSSHSSTFMIRGLPNGNLNEGCVGMDMIRGRFDMREALVREVEKERIRAEIIAKELGRAEELGRRRVLEEEVRNELRMEREMMAIRSNGGFPSQFMPVSVPPSHINRLEPRFLHQQPVGLEERIVMSIADKHGHGVHRGFSVSPFPRSGELPKITGIPKPQPEDTKKEVIVLSKPSGESPCGMKRKSVTPVAEGSSEPCADISKKKAKEEWSCAICQVSATSKRGLNDHLQGKKHHLKEAALTAQKTGANIGLGVAPKKPIAKPVKLSLTTVDLSSSKGKKSKTKKILVNETPATIRTPITPVTPVAEGSSEPRADISKKKAKEEWSCAICQVSATSKRGLNDHLQGKKHHLKEAETAQKTGANIGLGVAPKKPIAKPVKLSLTTVDLSSSKGKKSKTKKILVNETPATIRTPITPESSDTKAEAIKKENKSINFKFWCEMCQVGAYSENVMNNHKQGKMHLNHLAKQFRKGKVDTEAPATEKACDAEEKTKTNTKNVVDVEMVAYDVKTDTQTMKSVDVEIVANEVKSETETKKEVVVEVVKTVMDDKQDVTENEADTVVEEDEAEV